MKYLPAFLFSLTVLWSCSPGDADSGMHSEKDGGSEIHAIVTYRERVSLPANATVELMLSDESVADTIAAVVVKKLIPVEGRQVPLSLAIPVPTEQLQPGHGYALRARVMLAGMTMFATPGSYPALLDHEPLEVMLERVSPEGRINRPLENTEWRLVAATDVPGLESLGVPGLTLQLLPSHREVIGSAGCSHISGPYILRGGSLRVGSLTMTASCDEISAHSAVLRGVLQVARGWRVSGDTLTLSGAGRQARFVATPK
ncbi:MAG: YbaY family lipoprotein [Gemmatimonadota bacterium]|jgi:putative lipoprotein|nr:YbaY family lipoprotein [Gemmatimonadota bacterium]